MAFLSRAALAAITVLIAVNIKSAPLAWHLRMYLHWFRARLTKANLIQTKPRSLMSKFIQHHRVFCDDADYNGHMSNSAYAKIFDFTRCEIMANFFARRVFMSDDVGVALGGTCFTFLSEIKLGTAYTTHTSIVSWDAKWLYFACEFKSNDGKRLHAIGLGRYVFKHKNGKTMPPAEAIWKSNFGDHDNLEVVATPILADNSLDSGNRSLAGSINFFEKGVAHAVGAMLGLETAKSSCESLSQKEEYERRMEGYEEDRVAGYSIVASWVEQLEEHKSRYVKKPIS